MYSTGQVGSIVQYSIVQHSRGQYRVRQDTCVQHRTSREYSTGQYSTVQYSRGQNKPNEALKLPLKPTTQNCPPKRGMKIVPSVERSDTEPFPKKIPTVSLNFENWLKIVSKPSAELR